MNETKTLKIFLQLIAAPKKWEEKLEYYLGPNYNAVLNFWNYVERLSENQMSIVEKRYIEMGYPSWNDNNVKQRPEEWKNVAKAAHDTVGQFAGLAALAASGDYPWSTASDATYEIIGFETSKKLTFLPLFEFDNFDLLKAFN